MFTALKSTTGLLFAKWTLWLPCVQMLENQNQKLTVVLEASDHEGPFAMKDIYENSTVS